MKLAGRFRWLLEKKCREKGIDVHLIDFELTYQENVTNIEKLTHQALTKREIERERKRKKEPIKDVSDSLRDMGYVSNLTEEMDRVEKLTKEKRYEEEV
jgi:uncharacterized protein (UPF0335 family)